MDSGRKSSCNSHTQQFAMGSVVHMSVIVHLRRLRDYPIAQSGRLTSHVVPHGAKTSRVPEVEFNPLVSATTVSMLSKRSFTKGLDALS